MWWPLVGVVCHVCGRLADISAVHRVHGPRWTDYVTPKGYAISAIHLASDGAGVMGQRATGEEAHDGGTMGADGPSSSVSLVQVIPAASDQTEGMGTMSASTRVRYDIKEGL